MLRSLRSLSLTLAAVSLLAPAAANATSPSQPLATAATSSTAGTYPVITKIKPRELMIGEKLTVYGKHFRAGAKRSSVAFYRPGKPVIFVKADSATQTKLVVTVTEKVGGLLKTGADGAPVATLLRLRVIGAKMGKSWTQNSRSPRVRPIPAPPGVPAGATPEQQAAAKAYQTCQEQAAGDPPGDKDSDGVMNGEESRYGLDPCTADTDGDTLVDGYEYWSAIDLNGRAVPYPGKRPWPNPLDPSDTNYDFDGDWLSLTQEYKLWKAAGSRFPLTAYSDGTQNSGGPQPVTTVEEGYRDNDGDGNLTDDERDFDGDKLSNITEFNFRGTQDWWRGVDWGTSPHHPAGQKSYVENWYTARAFSDLDAVDADSDGDGIVDGDDDQDNDGWSNFAEMQLSRAQIGYRVHPFNPCLPNPRAVVCSRYVPMEAGRRWPPFDVVDGSIGLMSQMPGDAYPFSWNPAAVQYATWTGSGSPDRATGTVFGPWDPSPWFAGEWQGESGPQGP